MAKGYSSVLVISDLHAPWQHPDALDFLAAIKKKIKPDFVLNVGDECDAHALSMWESDPDLPSAGDELKMARKVMHDLEKIFPDMTLLHSNHSSLIYRRALKHGMPRAYLKHYNEFLQVGKGWEWVDDIKFKLSDGTEVFASHGLAADGLKLSLQYGCHTIQGHFHSKAAIQYFSNPSQLVWSLQVGCLTKQSSLAFQYARNFRMRFIISTGAVIDGQPVIFPMQMDKHGRWTGKIV
jgi:hypothetical protein